MDTMPADHLWYPPERSRASRIVTKPSRGGSRVTIVAGSPEREFHLESHLEAKAAFVMLARRETVDLWEQPPAIPYEDTDGRTRRHTFDFLQTLRDGTRVLVAVKPWRRAIEQDLPRTLRSIAEQIGASGIDVADRVALLTERRLGRDTVHNARLILSARRDVDPEADAAVAEVVADLHGETTLRNIACTSGFDGRGFRAGIRLIAAGRLVVPKAARLAPETSVRAAHQTTSEAE
ncbi:TnsA endonuclease N-terminal domain-containing protein [Methylobacterium radiodurans]|nr:TnsA endonuclease N-terminal domain-containing protein [Methylobacterium radiodurans]